MDSQSLSSNYSPVCLTFSKNSMINATLSRDSRPAYTLTTKLQGSTTEIRAPGSTEVQARISSNLFLPDTVEFPNIRGGPKVRLSKWMKNCKLADGSRAHIIETEMGKCVLKQHHVYRLALFMEHDLDNPIARWYLGSGNSQLSLILSQGTETFHLQVIAAFIIQELRMRGTETSSQMAFGRAQMEAGVGRLADM
ncbi:hypothetical protein C8R45DRAFT_1038723 [Mycena sanguinolenta]|nr:hypothetical protein C8R45DRAFT_1038723 [Mycena sanguinolenta]